MPAKANQTSDKEKVVLDGIRCTATDTPSVCPEVVFDSRIVGAIERELGSIPDVMAVFLSQSAKVYSIFTVLPEFDPEVEETVYDAEDRIQEQFPQTMFDFTIRLAQGNDSADVVPIAQKAVYFRKNG